ncbi:hypothetical protein HanPSC8_Chr14g0614611 [Helianthus annuus]|nr:hypothetical protein HanPSC8_Chr14g0614611 [Helianthus annuus]
MCDVRIVSNSITTSFIVGLYLPFQLKHRIARLATCRSSSLVASLITIASKTDITRPSSIANKKCVAKLLCSPNLLMEIGFSPVKSSTKTTPKLYTSLFSVN